jgi:hypothetical protein
VAWRALRAPPCFVFERADGEACLPPTQIVNCDLPSPRLVTLIGDAYRCLNRRTRERYLQARGRYQSVQALPEMAGLFAACRAPNCLETKTA